MRVMLLALLWSVSALALAGRIAAESDPDDLGTTMPSRPTGATPTACVRTTMPPAPPAAGPGQAAASNQPGAFSYSGQAAGRTGTETYVWENPSVSAGISWGGQSAAGSFSLVLKDACDKEVFRQSFGSTSQGGSTAASEVGQAGDWLVSLEFTAFTGQMGLSVTSG